MTNTIITENKNYWTNRAATYSDVNKGELADFEHKMQWSNEMCSQITKAFPNLKPSEIKVLEIGTGPGFLAILLAEAGYDVTAVDLTPNMLKEAKANAGDLVDRIKFHEMNAEELTFDSESFHVIVSRNLTWNLPHPEVAYEGWCRVLKQGGILLNFDANWYGYLYDKDAKEAYDTDRKNTADAGYFDMVEVKNYDIMEDIAKRIPLSSIQRPAWDCQVLSNLGMNVTFDNIVWQKLWTKEEQTNFLSTPMFALRAVKN